MSEILNGYYQGVKAHVRSMNVLEDWVRSESGADIDDSRDAFIARTRQQFEQAIAEAGAAAELLVGSLEWPEEYWAYLERANSELMRLSKLIEQAEARLGEDAPYAGRLRGDYAMLFSGIIYRYADWAQAMGKVRAERKTPGVTPDILRLEKILLIDEAGRPIGGEDA